MKMSKQQFLYGYPITVEIINNRLSFSKIILKRTYIGVIERSLGCAQTMGCQFTYTDKTGFKFGNFISQVYPLPPQPPPSYNRPSPQTPYPDPSTHPDQSSPRPSLRRQTGDGPLPDTQPLWQIGFPGDHHIDFIATLEILLPSHHQTITVRRKIN